MNINDVNRICGEYGLKKYTSYDDLKFAYKSLFIIIIKKDFNSSFKLNLVYLKDLIVDERDGDFQLCVTRPSNNYIELYTYTENDLRQYIEDIMKFYKEQVNKIRLNKIKIDFE